VVSVRISLTGTSVLVLKEPPVSWTNQ
jgi:hypothetical protein